MSLVKLIRTCVFLLRICGFLFKLLLSMQKCQFWHDCFVFCELKLKVLSESVSLAISTCWSCQRVSSELQFRNLMSIWFCIRFLAMLHLSSGWGKLICHKMMQHRRCHLIKEPSIWRNIWAPNSSCSISGTKLIQNKVLWHTIFLNF